VVGRVSRPDQDKWSSNTWSIYNRIQYEPKRALMLGMNESTHNKCGPAPAWAECLRPQAISVPEYFGRIHCLLPVNGGARENWPRAGLEAMAAGVPIVAQDAWGWREMIEHGVTGFLGATDAELAHWAAVLAHDEERRLQIAHAAYKRLVEDLANPLRIAEAWGELFGSLREPAHV
jgi:glycosyltransferase involved in cell wall biosynthesis